VQVGWEESPILKKSRGKISSGGLPPKPTSGKEGKEQQGSAVLTTGKKDHKGLRRKESEPLLTEKLSVGNEKPTAGGQQKPQERKRGYQKERKREKERSPRTAYPQTC